MKGNYSYHSRKQQGFRRGVFVGYKDVFQMTGIRNAKGKDLIKVEKFVLRQGCKIFAERVETTINGESNIMIWTNKSSFNAWQVEVDKSLSTSKKNDGLIHRYTKILVPRRKIWLGENVASEGWRVLILNPYDEDDRGICFVHSRDDAGSHTMDESSELFDAEGSVMYIFWPYWPYHYHSQLTSDDEESLPEQGNPKRMRMQCDRLTYETLGVPKK